MKLSILGCLAIVATSTNAQCNPMNGVCPPIPGLVKNSYSIDFTQYTNQPSDWILADSAIVKYGSNGVDFTFNKRFDAPYIWSSFYLLFGRVEVVLKAAPGTGIITGAVLMSDTLDEIDWEWSGNNFGFQTGKVQTNYFGKGVTGNYDRGTQPPMDDPVGQFHTYVLDWTPESLTWSIDGNVIRTLKGNSATSGAHQYPQTPSRFHLGVWDGGDPDGFLGTIQWAGGYTDFTKVPFTAYVKSVKITTPNPCSSWQYPAGFSGKWQDVKCTNTTISTTTKVTSTPVPTNLPCTYTVVAGDYGYAIAVKLGIPFADLKEANPGIDWDKLELGRNLKVPGGRCDTSVTGISTTSPALTISSAIPTSTQSTMSSSLPQSSGIATSTSPQPATYTVVAGDYGYKIAEKLGCSFVDLQKVNPGIDWDKLNIGQFLNIPSTGSSTTPGSSFGIGAASVSSLMQPIGSSLSPLQATSSSTTRPGSGMADFNCTTNLDTTVMATKTGAATSVTLTSIKSSSSSSSSASLSFAITTSPTTRSTTGAPNPTVTTTKLICNRDNCLNNLLDSRYQPSVRTFCPSFLSSSTSTVSASPVPIPTYLSGCQNKPERVMSACACLVSMNGLTTINPSSALSTSSTTSMSVVSVVKPTSTMFISSAAGSSSWANIWARFWRW